MIPAVYCGTMAGTSPRWAQAFARGCGGTWEAYSGWSGAGAGGLACFGHPMLEPLVFQTLRRGLPLYYGDHAYFGRGRFFRCTRGALQHAGLEGEADPARFLSFGIPVKPWRQAGGHVLLCPNSQSFLQRHGAPTWLDDTVTALKRHTDREIRLRWKADTDKRPLAVDLRDCWAVVTFTSNAAVEAILAGVPAFATAPCAASAMGSADLAGIERPRMPDGREAWAARLANNQWTLEEMAEGRLWRAIGGEQ